MTHSSSERRIVHSVKRISHSTKRLAPLYAAVAHAGCRRAPTFNILGSFFPAWLVCMFAGVLLAVAANRVLVHFKIDEEISWPIVVYPCLALTFACVLWLSFFS